MICGAHCRILARRLVIRFHDGGFSDTGEDVVDTGMCSFAGVDGSVNGGVRARSGLRVCFCLFLFLYCCCVYADKCFVSRVPLAGRPRTLHAPRTEDSQVSPRCVGGSCGKDDGSHDPDLSKIPNVRLGVTFSIPPLSTRPKVTLIPFTFCSFSFTGGRVDVGGPAHGPVQRRPCT